MKVEFFDTHEEAMERLTEAMKAADARVVDWQAAMKPGEFFMAESGGDFPVFGEVLEDYREKRLRHYRFCRCFSEVCPEGELGDVHVSTILCKLSRAAFERVREQGWRL
ncbi:MAG: hypothetical protein R6V58_07750 [Planctomycetota bacterium]